MKLIILISMFSINVYAVENYFPVGKNGAKTTYTSKSNCESIESHFCFEISGKNPLLYKVLPNGELEIDNAKKAAHDASNKSIKDADALRKKKVKDCISTLDNVVVSLTDVKNCLLSFIKENRGL